MAVAKPSALVDDLLALARETVHDAAMLEKVEILSEFEPAARAVVFAGDCLSLLKTMPRESVKLVVTSPPYNIGKEYEQRLNLDDYIKEQTAIIAECVRVLRKDGSVCNGD